MSRWLPCPVRSALPKCREPVSPPGRLLWQSASFRSGYSHCWRAASQLSAIAAVLRSRREREEADTMSENVFCPNCGTPAVHRSRVAPFSANSIIFHVTGDCVPGLKGQLRGGSLTCVQPEHYNFRIRSFDKPVHALMVCVRASWRRNRCARSRLRRSRL